MPTREHLRAQNALQAVRELKHEDWASSYRSYVGRLGPAILRNGLGQALAGELASAGAGGGDKDAHQRLFDNLENWLCGADKDTPYPPPEGQQGDRLLDHMIQGTEADYRRAHAEALAWLEWHKRFCRAYLPKKRTSAEHNNASASEGA